MKQIIKGESGWENAKRFTDAVRQAAAENRVIIFWGEQWPWMKNTLWREEVTGLLTQLGVKVENSRWLPPDDLDSDWMFTAHSTATVHRVSQLVLDATIEDGLDFAHKTIEFVKKPVCWWCFIILGIVIATALGTCSQLDKPEAPTQERIP